MRESIGHVLRNFWIVGVANQTINIGKGPRSQRECHVLESIEEKEEIQGCVAGFHAFVVTDGTTAAVRYTAIFGIT